MELRPYSESDEEVCAAWFPAEGTDPFMDRKWLGAAASAARHDPEHHSLLVGCQEGQPVSIFSLSHVPGGKRAGVSLLVAPNVRSTGLGRATVEALRDTFPKVEEFVAFVDPKNDRGLALVKSLGLERASYKDPDRELFVWRRDGTPVPPDWEPPKVPLR